MEKPEIRVRRTQDGIYFYWIEQNGKVISFDIDEATFIQLRLAEIRAQQGSPEKTDDQKPDSRSFAIL